LRSSLFRTFKKNVLSIAFDGWLYRSVTLSSMARAFGVSVPLLDKELSHFIATGRLTAKIDSVGDLVETNRADKRNAQYQEVVKKGDVLLNHIQKLVRVIGE
jgi:26S proteasome regulatory subunit N7